MVARRFSSINEVLDFAIGEEEQAEAFYLKLAEKVDKKWVAQVLRDFSKEEAGHKEKLLSIKAGKLLTLPPGKVQDLQIAEAVEPPTLGSSLDYQQVLIVAMQKEKEAFRLYSDLAQRSDNPNLRQTFSLLAMEEAKHKLRFEIEYDEFVNREN
jgi:rubrerythrin